MIDRQVRQCLQLMTIPANLLHAYLTTTYVVPDLNLHIRIGQHHAALDDLLHGHNAITWAFITASNPASLVLSPEENARRHQELLLQVDRYPHWEGIGVGEDPAWEPEQSLLIVGIPRDEAAALGRRFGQNAIVTGVVGHSAEMIILT